MLCFQYYVKTCQRSLVFLDMIAKFREPITCRYRYMLGACNCTFCTITTILEIHACNNPSPVLKRCILSAVASTSSQGGVRLDRGGGGWWLPKCFQMYKNISGHIIIFPKIQLFSKFTFSCPENYLNSPENLLKFYINLSALEIYLKFLMSNYHGVAPPPPPPSEFQANTL